MKNFIIGLLAVAAVIVLIPFIPSLLHIAFILGLCWVGFDVVCWIGKKIGGGK